MRLLAQVFEEGKVDMVFSGHVHNYQRFSAPESNKQLIYIVAGAGSRRGE